MTRPDPSLERLRPRDPNLVRLLPLLEKASAGSPSLDALIIAFLYGEPSAELDGLIQIGVARIPHYTTSLDAASSLVPGGWQWGTATYPPEELFNPGGAQGFCSRHGRDGKFIGHTHADAKTPALALCIAALKANLEVSKSAPSVMQTQDSGASSQESKDFPP